MIYRFGEFTLRPDRYELRRSGEPLAIEPLVLEVLAYLAEHRDRTVSKAELLEALWEGEYVTESALTRTIRELRKALGDSASEPRFIKTVYGRGYLFVAQVDEDEEARPPATPGDRGQQPASRSASAIGQPTPFVGRTAEMEHLRHALESAVAGAGRLVMLVGEPGIGKTRTAQALATEAEDLGVRPLWARSLEGLRAPPYWLWVQLIRDYVETVDAGRLQSEMGVGAADIAEIVAEVRLRLPDLAPAPALEDPEQARFRLFDSVARFFRRGSSSQPLLLLLDNLHWADRPSLRLLEFLAPELRDSRILVVGTYRDVELSRQHPLSDTLAELAREGLLDRVPLPRLSREEVGHYVAQVVPGAPASLVDGVQRRTEGNPFFVVEVVRLLVQEGLLRPERSGPARPGAAEAPRTLSVPEGVREVIGRRLNRLSERCNAVLQVAGVIGRSFALTELEHLVEELPRERLAECLEEAESAGLLQALTGARGRYQFTHALIHETLVDEVGTARRARLHRRIGEALEVIHAGRIDACLPRLAHHFFEATLAGRADKAIDYCLRAARQAAGVMAYDQAAWLLERALEALEQSRPVGESRLCRLRLECGTALARSGQPARALEMFQRAASAARRLGSAEMLAEAALGMGAPDPGATFGLHAEPALRLLEEALSALDATDRPLRVRLLCGLAAAHHALGRLEEGKAVGGEALAMARRLGDPRSVLAALRSTLGLTVLVSGRDEASAYLPRIDEMLRLAEELGDTFSLIDAHGYRADLLLSSGDLEGFREEIEQYAAQEERLRQPAYLCLRPLHEAALATLEGRFEDAERLALEARTAGRRVRFPNIDGVFSSQMFTLRRLQGRLEEIAAAAEQFLGDRSAAAVWGPGAAVVFLELGHLERARGELERQAALGFEALPRDVMWQTSLCYYGEVACAVGDLDSARRIYELLLPAAGSVIARGGSGACLGAAGHYLGELAAALGLESQATDHFEEAVALNASMGARPWLALTEERLARHRAAAGQDRSGTRKLAERALATARDLGMRGLEQRAANTLESLGGGGRRAAVAAEASGLTPREVEVLRLLAAGKSNREVGAALSISPHTVATHVRSILAKTGAATRAEAAAHAVRAGLAPPR